MSTTALGSAASEVHSQHSHSYSQLASLSYTVQPVAVAPPARSSTCSSKTAHQADRLKYLLKLASMVPRRMRGARNTSGTGSGGSTCVSTGGVSTSSGSSSRVMSLHPRHRSQSIHGFEPATCQSPSDAQTAPATLHQSPRSTPASVQQPAGGGGGGSASHHAARHSLPGLSPLGSAAGAPGSAAARASQGLLPVLQLAGGSVSVSVSGATDTETASCGSNTNSNAALRSMLPSQATSTAGEVVGGWELRDSREASCPTSPTAAFPQLLPSPSRFSSSDVRPLAPSLRGSPKHAGPASNPSTVPVAGSPRYGGAASNLGSGSVAGSPAASPTGSGAHVAAGAYTRTFSTPRRSSNMTPASMILGSKLSLDPPPFPQ
mmetsp:Transcript_27172/g.69171  ORF Transcript_27172/g.69171 Transcript_27172/m.69171 type:complete len:376 (-) Transcript_27172:1200-2327(-)